MIIGGHYRSAMYSCIYYRYGNADIYGPTDNTHCVTQVSADFIRKKLVSLSLSLYASWELLYLCVVL